ncbi:Forkhead transcription factor [Malassezia sp. CBS 17886]|nr:Forkhead transcription factor [Malassezia sp. CBS 17886]
MADMKLPLGAPMDDAAASATSDANMLAAHATASGSMGDANDFLTRAQALGLRLTRADFERTRAGVTAFLKAERLPADSPAPSVDDGEEAERTPHVPERAPSPPMEPEDSHALQRGNTPALSRWLRTTSGQLSFFTEVVRPAGGTGEDSRSRITLDEVGNAEEKRRRRLRRRRMLEKQMLLEDKCMHEGNADEPRSPTHSPARTIRASSAASESVEHGSSRIEPTTPTATEYSDVPSSTPLSHRTLDEKESAMYQSSPPLGGGPNLHVLNRMARMDQAGKLWLAPRAHELDESRAHDAADDSGVFVDVSNESSSSSALLGWGLRPMLRTSSGADNLDACMKSMSLLDRVMMRKSSPRRIRREARARARGNSGALGPAFAAYVSEDDSLSYVRDDSRDTEHDGDQSFGSTWDASSESAGLRAHTPGSDTQHRRRRSLSVRFTQQASTPLRVRTADGLPEFLMHDTPPHDGAPAPPTDGDVRGVTSPSLTPVPKYDLSTQITPMRYSPSFAGCTSHGRATSIFSPNMLTPWTHQGRLMSNAGLTHVPSSPFVLGDLSASTGLPRVGGAFSSTPLSHLPFSEADAGMCVEEGGAASSPGRILYLESFPGRSPRKEMLTGSPCRKSRRSPAPLLAEKRDAPETGARRGHRSASSRSGSAQNMTASIASRLDLVSRMAPALDGPMTGCASGEMKPPFRRMDTISPADIFHAGPVMVFPSAADAAEPEAVSASDGYDMDAQRASPAAPASRASMPVRGATPPAEALSKPRAPRRANTMVRSSSALSSAMPAHGDDVFTKDTGCGPPGAPPPFRDVFHKSLPPPDAKQMEWEQPDGSKIVKLVSEEMQAAMDAGTLDTEPEPRYFHLPPGYGRTKTKPSSVSYAGLIGQAILSSSDGRLSLAEIYQWISSVYPFYERGDRGWQNSIRHNLSLNKSFVKLERESSIPGKGGWWAIESGHESRFRDGLYLPSVVRSEAFKATYSAPAVVLKSPPGAARSQRKKRVGMDGAVAEETVRCADDASTSTKRPKTSARLERRAQRTAHATNSSFSSEQRPACAPGAQPGSSALAMHRLPLLTDASSPPTSPLGQRFPAPADAADAHGGIPDSARLASADPRFARAPYPYVPMPLQRTSPGKGVRSMPVLDVPARSGVPCTRALGECPNYNMRMYMANAEMPCVPNEYAAGTLLPPGVGALPSPDKHSSLGPHAAPGVPPHPMNLPPSYAPMHTHVPPQVAYGNLFLSGADDSHPGSAPWADGLAVRPADVKLHDLGRARPPMDPNMSSADAIWPHVMRHG